MFQTAKIVGLNSDQLAAQVLIVDHQPQTSYVLVLSAVCDDAFSQVRQALAQVEDELENLAELPMLERLKSLEQKVISLLNNPEEVGVIVAAFDKQSCYLIRHGKLVAAYLLRSGNLSELSSIAAEGKLISGLLQEGDRVVISTTSLKELLKEDFSQLKDWSLDEVEDEIAPRLSSAKVDPIATVIIDQAGAHTTSAQSSPEVIPEAQVQIHPDQLPPKLKQKIGAMIPHHRPHLKHYLPKTKKSGLIVGGALLLLIAVGMVVNVQRQKSALITAQYLQHYQRALNSYNQAVALKDLDTNSAKDNLTVAQTELKAALKLKPTQKEGLDLQKQITDNTGVILKVVQVTEFPVWLDLDLIKKNLTTKQLSFSVGQLLILDSAQKSLVAIDVTKKSNQILAGGDKLGEAQYATINGDNAFVFASDKGVLKVEMKRGSTPADPVVAIKRDDGWGRVSDIYGFAGNLYMADEFKNAIWKYIPTTAGYSDSRNYLAEDVKVDLAGAIKLQIDSSVWVMKNGGELLKFTQGYVDNFSYSHLDKPIDNPKSFYVSDETDNLYLLDSGNSRLLVLDKKGNYLSQYQSDQFKEFVDFVVDEENKKVLLLSGSKIYQMDLK